MTRKDFELIAATIRSLKVAPEIRNIVATQFAMALRRENSRFDTERFHLAAMENDFYGNMAKNPPKRLTLGAVRKELQKIGMAIRVTPEAEYRVNFKGGKEETAYYASQLDDALATAQRMVHGYPAPNTRKNPPIRGGRYAKGKEVTIGAQVYAVTYRHMEDGEDYKHEFEDGVALIGQPDGSILILSDDGKPLWENRKV